MDCHNAEDYLAAYADGELSSEEERALREHLGEEGGGPGCAGCRARLAEQRALKALVREHVRLDAAPAALRARILAGLEAAAREEAKTARPGSESRRYGRPSVRLVALAALAAALVLMLRAGLPNRHEAPGTSGIAMFDRAIESFSGAEKGFAPDVPSTSPAEVARAYRAAHMPSNLWVFSPSGYRLVGGRLDRLPDGRPVAYTLYRGAKGDILCVFLKPEGRQAPAHASERLDGHSFYAYRGYSICYTAKGDFLCLLVSRAALAELVEDVRRAGSLPG